MEERAHDSAIRSPRNVQRHRDGQDRGTRAKRRLGLLDVVKSELPALRLREATKSRRSAPPFRAVVKRRSGRQAGRCCRAMARRSTAIGDRRCHTVALRVTTLRYRYRAYPTRGQEKSFARLLGCCRVVFNDAVAAREAAHAGAGTPTPRALSSLPRWPRQNTPLSATTLQTYRRFHCNKCSLTSSRPTTTSSHR